MSVIVPIKPTVYVTFSIQRT